MNPVGGDRELRIELCAETTCAQMYKRKLKPISIETLKN